MGCSSIRQALSLASCLVLLGGCETAYRSAPVKPDVALQTLQTTLDEWKSGATLESLRKRTPEIVVQDLDWTRGKKLVAYEVLGNGEPVDANLIAKVKLTLQDAEGQNTEKTVTYVVGTSPVLTVFRDLTR
jgi:hypothetical protein